MASIIKMRSKKGGFLYYVRFKLGGSEKWKSAGRNMEVAKRIRAKIENDLMNERYDLFDKKEPAIFSWYVDNKYLPPRKSIARYQSDYSACKHLKSFFGDVLLNRITAEDIRDYIADKTGKLSSRTINDHLTTLNQILRWSQDAGYISENPFLKGIANKTIQKPRNAKKTRFLTEAEFKSLLEYSTPWVKAYVTLAFYSGMRAGEMSNLKLSDICFDSKINAIKVDATHSKNKKERYIRMNNALRNLMLWLKDNMICHQQNVVIKREAHQRTYVFCEQDGTQIKVFRRSFDRAVKRAGLQGVTLHTLRHSFASHLVMKGVPLVTIQKLLGHSNISVTANFYSHISEAHMQEAVNKLDVEDYVEDSFLPTGTDFIHPQKTLQLK
jgi:site-specific recombinase XerD